MKIERLSHLFKLAHTFSLKESRMVFQSPPETPGNSNEIITSSNFKNIVTSILEELEKTNLTKSTDDNLKPFGTSFEYKKPLQGTANTLNELKISFYGTTDGEEKKGEEKKGEKTSVIPAFSLKFVNNNITFSYKDYDGGKGKTETLTNLTKNDLRDKIYTEYRYIVDRHNLETKTIEGFKDLSVKLSKDLMKADGMRSDDFSPEDRKERRINYLLTSTEYKNIEAIMRGKPFEIVDTPSAFQNRIGNFLANKITRKMDINDVFKLANFKTSADIEEYKGEKIINNESSFTKYREWILNERFNKKSKFNKSLLDEEHYRLKFIAAQMEKLLKAFDEKNYPQNTPQSINKDKTSASKAAQEKLEKRNQAENAGYRLFLDTKNKPVITKDGLKVYIDAEGKLYDENAKQIMDYEISKNIKEINEDRYETIKKSAETTLNKKTKLIDLKHKFATYTTSLPPHDIDLEGDRIKITWKIKTNEKTSGQNLPPFFISCVGENNFQLMYYKEGLKIDEPKPITLPTAINELVTTLLHHREEAIENASVQKENLDSKTDTIDIEKNFKKETSQPYKLKPSVIDGMKNSTTKMSGQDNAWLNRDGHISNYDTLAVCLTNMGIANDKVPQTLQEIIENWSNKSLKFRDILKILIKKYPDFLPKENQTLLLTDGFFDTLNSLQIVAHKIIKTYKNHPEYSLLKDEKEILNKYNTLVNILENGIRLAKELERSEYIKGAELNTSKEYDKEIANLPSSKEKTNIVCLLNIDKIPTWETKEKQWGGALAKDSKWNPETAKFDSEKDKDKFALGLTKKVYEQFKTKYEHFIKTEFKDDPEKQEKRKFKDNSGPYILRVILRAYEKNFDILLKSGDVIKKENNQLIIKNYPDDIPDKAMLYLYEDMAITGTRGIVDTFDVLHEKQKDEQEKAKRESLAKGTPEYYKNQLEKVISESLQNKSAKEKVESWLNEWVLKYDDGKNRTWLGNLFGDAINMSEMTVSNQGKKVNANQGKLIQHWTAISYKIFDDESLYDNKGNIKEPDLLAKINKTGQQGANCGIFAKDNNNLVRTYTAKMERPTWTNIKDLSELTAEKLLMFMAGFNIGEQEEVAKQDNEIIKGIKSFDDKNLQTYLETMYLSGKKQETIELIKALKNQSKLEKINLKLKKLNDALIQFKDDLKTANKDKEKIKNAYSKMLGGIGVAVDTQGHFKGLGGAYNIDLGDGYSAQIGIGVDNEGHISPGLGFQKGDEFFGFGIGATLSGAGIGADVSISNTFAAAINKAFGTDWKPELDIILAFGIATDFTDIENIGGAAAAGISTNVDNAIENTYKEILSKKWAKFHKENFGTNLEQQVPFSKETAAKIKTFFNENLQLIGGKTDIFNNSMAPTMIVATYNAWLTDLKSVAVDRANKTLASTTLNSVFFTHEFGADIHLDHIPVINLITGLNVGAAFKIKGLFTKPIAFFGAVIGIGGRKINIYDTEQGRAVAEEVSEEQVKAIEEMNKTDKAKLDKNMIIVGPTGDFMLKVEETGSSSRSSSTDTKEPDQEIAYLSTSGEMLLKTPEKKEGYTKVRAFSPLDRKSKNLERNIRIYVDDSAKGISVAFDDKGRILIPGNHEDLYVISQTFKYYAPLTKGGSPAEEIIVITKDENFSTQKIIEEAEKVGKIEVRNGKPTKMERFEGALGRHSQQKNMLFKWETMAEDQRKTFLGGEEYMGLSPEEKSSLDTSVKNILESIYTKEKSEDEKTKWSETVGKTIWTAIKKGKTADGTTLTINSQNIDMTNRSEILEEINKIITPPLSQKAQEQLWPYLNDRHYVEVYKGCSTRKQIEAKFEAHHEATKQAYIDKFNEAVTEMGITGDTGTSLEGKFSEINKKNFGKLLGEIETYKKTKNIKSFGEAYIQYLQIKDNGHSIENSIVGIGTTIRETKDPRISLFPTTESSLKMATKQSIDDNNLKAAILYITYGKEPKTSDAESFKSPLAIRLAFLLKEAPAIIGGTENYKKLSEFYKNSCKYADADADAETKQAVDKFIEFVGKVKNAILNPETDPENSNNPKPLLLNGGYKLYVKANLFCGSYGKCANPTVGIDQFPIELVSPINNEVITVSNNVNPEIQSGYAETKAGAGAAVLPTNKSTPKSVPPKPTGPNPNPPKLPETPGGGEFPNTSGQEKPPTATNTGNNNSDTLGTDGD